MEKEKLDVLLTKNQEYDAKFKTLQNEMCNAGIVKLHDEMGRFEKELKEIMRHIDNVAEIAKDCSAKGDISSALVLLGAITLWEHQVNDFQKRMASKLGAMQMFLKIFA